MSDLINESMKDEAVYRTAPATSGLLNVSEIRTMLLLNYQTKITQDKKSRAGWTEKKNQGHC